MITSRLVELFILDSFEISLKLEIAWIFTNLAMGESVTQILNNCGVIDALLTEVMKEGGNKSH